MSIDKQDQKTDGMIGYDPLAWIKEDAAQTSAGDDAKAEVGSAAVPASGNGTVIDLGDQLVIAAVTGLRAEWMDVISSEPECPLLLEGGDVQSVDTAGLQLLLSLVKEMERENMEWEWGNSSTLLLGGAQQLGLSELLAL